MWQVRGRVLDFDFWSCDLTSCMWQVRRPGFVFGFGLVTQQAVCGKLGDHGLVFCHSLGHFWVHWSGLGFLWNVNFKVLA